VRDVMALRIQRLDERFAENGQVGFVAFQRTDGRLVSAGQPIKWYANSAT
jgi:HK97 family phage major capsid protein